MNRCGVLSIIGRSASRNSANEQSEIQEEIQGYEEVDTDVNTNEPDTLKEEKQLEDGDISKCMENYFWISKKEYRKTILAYVISRILGINKTKQLLKKKGM